MFTYKTKVINLFFLPILLGMSVLSINCNGQSVSKVKFLRGVAIDLNESKFEFPKNKVKIIGFGAIHGSAKTEDAELQIIKELLSSNALGSYLPETDFSTAHYFNHYLETGDEVLLHELIIQYGERVPQEKSIEMFLKWKQLRNIFKGKEINVVGIDKIASYKFSVLQLVSLIRNDSLKTELVGLIENDNTNWSAYYNSQTQEILKAFVNRFRTNELKYLNSISDSAVFLHIINNLLKTFAWTNREHVIYENYITLKRMYAFDNKLQFVRFGSFHIVKSKINGSSTFFSKLVDNAIYDKSEILSIQGFLTQSKVLWEVKLDAKRNVKRISERKGIGTADYLFEYFKGIKYLKRSKISDITIFNLHKDSTPYNYKGNQDLVTVKKIFGRSPWLPESKKTTLDYIDYAILIFESPANRPIEVLNSNNYKNYTKQE